MECANTLYVGTPLCGKYNIYCLTIYLYHVATGNLQLMVIMYTFETSNTPSFHFLLCICQRKKKYLMVLIDMHLCTHTCRFKSHLFGRHRARCKVFQIFFFRPPSLGIADLVLINPFAVLNFVLLEYSAIHLRISLCLININEPHFTIPP